MNRSKKHLMMYNKFFIAMGAIYFTSLIQAYAQPSGQVSGQDTTRNVITTAVPFLLFTPDARHGGMGDAGVATSADANSTHWNPAKLAFIENNIGFSLSYTPWLAKIVTDMSISYLSGYVKVNEGQTAAFFLRYFDLGDIQLTDDIGNNLNIVNPREFSVGGSFGMKLSEDLGVGISGKFIHSNISSNIGSIADARPGISVAADVGVFYNREVTLNGKLNSLAFAATIQNIGNKITYNTAAERDFIPINLKLGTAYTMGLDPYNNLTFALDFNKLLVPTPPKEGNVPLLEGMFGSFGDAPGGFKEELREVNIAGGMEYWYNEIFAARLGYFYEPKQKGGRQYLTLGLGFRYQVFGIDFAYLVPQEQNHPLGETLRFTLLFDFNRE